MYYRGFRASFIAIETSKCRYVVHTGLFILAPKGVGSLGIFTRFLGEIYQPANSSIATELIPRNQCGTYQARHCRARNEDDLVVVISRLRIVASIFRHRYPNILNEFQFTMILGNINGEDIASVNVTPGELFSHPPNAI